MKTFLKIIFIFFIFFSIIYFYSDIIYNIKITFNLCFNSIFPSLIPFKSHPDMMWKPLKHTPLLFGYCNWPCTLIV